MQIAIDSFKNSEMIPRKYTCEGEDINPGIHISDIPPGTRSLALIMDDPDAPGGTWVHWVLWNIDLAIKEIPMGASLLEAVQGVTSRGKAGYHGPCPPSGMHRYYFKLYALDDVLDLDPHSDADALRRAMNGHVIEEAQYMGTYQKQGQG